MNSMAGYETTVIQPDIKMGFAPWLLGISAAFLIAVWPGSFILGAALVIPGALLIFWALYTFALSAARISWGPKGICYSQYGIAQALAFNEIASAQIETVSLKSSHGARRRKCTYLLLRSHGDQKRIKLQMDFFSASDLQIILRCLESNVKGIKIDLSSLQGMKPNGLESTISWLQASPTKQIRSSKPNSSS
jgi:hypothetical protein